MYANNLIIDKGNLIKIPQNSVSFFSIKKCNFLNYCIEIGIKPDEEINMLNLYLIVKSYSCSVLYPSLNFFIAIRNLNEESFIAYSINSNDFKNISYTSFITWFYKKLLDDRLYIKKECEYLFLFSYPIDIFDRNQLGSIKPDFPWKSGIIEKFSSILENETTLSELISIQKKEIDQLKSKINMLNDELRKKK